MLNSLSLFLFIVFFAIFPKKQSPALTGSRLWPHVKIVNVFLNSLSLFLFIVFFAIFPKKQSPAPAGSQLWPHVKIVNHLTNSSACHCFYFLCFSGFTKKQTIPGFGWQPSLASCDEILNCFP